MKIISVTSNLSPKESYMLICASSTKRFADVEEVPIKAYALIEEDDGKKVLYVLSTDNIVYATASKTFVESFEKLLMFCPIIPENAVLAVDKAQSTKNPSRQFITAIPTWLYDRY